jgi:hypothetical protein
MQTAFRMTIPADAAVVNPQTKAIEIVITTDTVLTVMDTVKKLATQPTDDGTAKAVRSAIQGVLSLFVMPWIDGNMEKDTGYPLVDYNDPLAKSDFLAYCIEYFKQFLAQALVELNYQGVWSVEDETVVVTGLVSGPAQVAVEAGPDATGPSADSAAEAEPSTTTAPEWRHSSIVTG